MLFDSLSELWVWCGANVGTHPLFLKEITIGIGVYREFIYSMRQEYVPGDSLRCGFENLLIYGPYGSIPARVSKIVPEDKIYLGTEEQYARILADQKCREILLGDIP